MALCESSLFGFLFFDSLSPYPVSSFHLRWFLGNLLLDPLILYHLENFAVGGSSLPPVPPHILGLAGWKVCLGFAFKTWWPGRRVYYKLGCFLKGLDRKY